MRTAVSQSTIVKASEADLAWLYPGLDREKVADRILGEGVSLLVITLGSKGAFGAHRDFRMAVAAPHVAVVHAAPLARKMPISPSFSAWIAT